MEEKMLGRTKVKYWYIKEGQEYVYGVALYTRNFELAKKFQSQSQAQDFADRCYWMTRYEIDCVIENVAEEHENKLGKNAFKL